MNFDIVSPSVKSSRYEMATRHAKTNPSKLIKPTNVEVCFRYGNTYLPAKPKETLPKKNKIEE